ncbi:putative transposase, Ptta/En/Spm, plant [Senna tora]|uniref:Putative transposase, Ptta/En/Spm, plant n=1 Tax=Senna tora TaxID=362788 RepID=A0A834SSD6_9FABA|nr:putative transposase, Ptta/En/Spm, plant [Senna tora]
MIDVRKLNRAHHELVVKQALATNDQENHKLLSAIKERLDSSKIVGITSNKQGQSPIQKRARFIPPSIVNSSAQLAETSYRQQCARTHPHKDKKIQLTHIQKRRSPRLKVAIANEKDNEVEGSEVEGDQNKTQNKEQQGPEIQEKQPSNIEASSEGEAESNKSKTRGPTLCAKVHGRIFEEREQIIFNANWQPIGPSDQALSNFSSFLGTIARTHVQYILHAQAERYVMKTINEAWRIHKCRVKISHFTKYRTDAERLKNRRLSIPETQFKKLIKYWKIEKVKRASKENHDSPSQVEIFVTPRRGNQRKQFDAETSNKIDKIQLQPSNLYLELRSMAKFVVMEEMSLYLL